MPRALVQPAGAPAEEDACSTGEDERGAGHEQGDGRVEAESLDNAVVVCQFQFARLDENKKILRGEERVERASAIEQRLALVSSLAIWISPEMEVLHENEEPGTLVAAGLLEALHGRGLAVIVRELVPLHAAMGNLSLALAEPAGRQRRVGKQPESEQGDHGRGDAFEQEEPAPAGEAGGSVHSREDTCGNEAGESRGEDLSTVQDGDAGCNLCSSCQHKSEGLENSSRENAPFLV